MIPYPNQNIKEWIGDNDTAADKHSALNILSPLRILNGNCLAYLLINNPQVTE
jgi:hypothetical protein